MKQEQQKMEKPTIQSALNCDTETGICAIPTSEEKSTDINIGAKDKKVRIIYFTDPICSSCWGIEPQLRKLEMEYASFFEIEYRMGGLLKSWESYGGSDVNGPSSTAVHWDDAGTYYQMPIDGDVWIEDPLHSSYPPSIAFKAAQFQGKALAMQFLRRIKEMVFTEKKNIAKKTVLLQAAQEVGLDIALFEKDFEGKAIAAFEADIMLAGQLGVRGFPTMFFSDNTDNKIKIYGSKPYATYENALLTLYPEAVKTPIDKDPAFLFNQFASLSTNEFAALTDQSYKEAEIQLGKLFENGQISNSQSKGGILWIKN